MSSKSRSASPKSPSNSPPRSDDKVEVKERRSPIRAPTRSPSRSPIPQRTNRVSRSPTPDGGERDEVMSVNSGDERSARRRSPSPRRRERGGHRDRSRSRSRDRRRSRRDRSRDREERRRRDRSRSHDRNRRSRSTSPKRARRESPVTNEKENENRDPAQKKEKEKKEPMDLLRTRAGGAYIPPAKLKLMQEQIADKTGEQYQRMNWERLKKKIHGLVNKVNTGNLVSVVRSLLQENVIRGKGLLSRSIIQAQAFSPVFSNVYAALVAVINSKFPHIGELILRRLIVQFKRSFRRNDKGTTVTVSKFIAHLINQQVAHELLALEIIILMLETPTDDSVEVSIAFLKECGAKLLQAAPKALLTVFDRLRNILHESEAGNLDKRIQYMIEVVMTVRKDGFKAFPAVIDELDLIEEDDQITHTITLEDAIDPENTLNVFKLDTEFEKNEAMYDEIRKEIIGDDDDSDEDDEDDDGGEGNEDGEDGAGVTAAPTGTTEIIDNTEQNLVAFRREVYLTIQSSLDYQEAAHKLLKMRVKKELEAELCHMLVDCCTQNRTYERFYGLLCERFCRLKKEFQMTFEQVARDTYATVHRFEITKLRNMSRLISHLLFTDAISWMVLSDIRLTEEDTTSSGRIYIKYIFQELCESMGLIKLYERVMDPTLQGAFAGIFPRDNPQNSRFAINFFTLIGLGGLTVDLREFLEKGAKKQKESAAALAESSDDTDTDSSDSSDSDSDSSSSSSSSSSDSDSEDEKRRRKKKAAAKKKKAKEQKKNKDDKENRRDTKKGHRDAEVDTRVKEEPASPERSPPRKDRRESRRDRDREEERSRTEKQPRRERDDRRKRSESRERRDDRKEEEKRDDRDDKRKSRRKDSRSPKRSEKRRDRSASGEVRDRGDRMRAGGERRRERSRS